MLDEWTGMSFHEISRIKKLLLNKHQGDDNHPHALAAHPTAAADPAAALAAAGEAAFQQLLEGQEKKEQFAEAKEMKEERMDGEDRKELIGRGWKMCPSLPKHWRIKTHYWGNRWDTWLITPITVLKGSKYFRIIHGGMGRTL